MLKFSDFLNQVIAKKMSRKELLVALHLNHHEFQGIDAITLSRWANNVTKPSLFKQLLVADTAGVLEEYLRLCDIPKMTKAMEEQVRQYTEQFESDYHYIQSPQVEKRIRFKEGVSSDCRSLFKYIYRFEIFRGLSKSLDLLGVTNNVKIFYIGDTSESESCIFFYEKFDEIFKVLGVGDDKLPHSISTNNSLFFGMAYFKNRQQFEYLFGLTFNYIIKNYFNRNYAYFTVRGIRSMRFFEALGSNLVYSYSEDSKLGNIYIYQIDIKKLCSNQLIFNMIKQYSDLYEYNFDTLAFDGFELFKSEG